MLFIYGYIKTQKQPALDLPCAYNTILAFL